MLEDGLGAGDSLSEVPDTYPIVCGHCERGVAATVTRRTQDARNEDDNVAWLLCPLCQDGSVKDRHHRVHPAAPAGRSVGHLPPTVEDAWYEVRLAHAVGAYTASEMMCRKILMHLAVDVANSKPGKKFVEYVNDLDSEGYVTKGLKPVVDKVRDRGNIANHELPASTEQDSLTTLTITEHLLRAIYELPNT